MDITQPSLRFGVAVARNSDPDTSWEAADSITEIPRRQAEVLQIIEMLGPICDYDLQLAHRMVDGLMPQSPSGLRTRRSELVALGLVVDTGDRKRLPSGRRAILWDIRPGEEVH